MLRSKAGYVTHQLSDFGYIAPLSLDPLICTSAAYNTHLEGESGGLNETT